jgi:hypothetical protein
MNHYTRKAHVWTVAMAALLVVGVAVPAQTTNPPPTTTTLKWMPGWDNLSAPLNFIKSNVQFSVGTHKITLTYNLVGGMATNLYQLSTNFFCTTFPKTFGQFPTEENSDGTCQSLTRQGVTKTSAEVEVGAILTDVHGNGSYRIVVSPVPSGTYELEFFVRNGAGCNVNGGGGNGASICEADYQSPGPFGNGVTIVVP